MISIDGFRAQRIIHQSSTTLVFSAIRELDGQEVVLKCPSPDNATLDQITRLHTEYEVLRRIHSPYVVKALDIREQNGLPVLVLEHIDLENLESLMSDRTFTLEDSIDLTIGLADSLDAIHSFNVVYKNLCPQNILVSEDLSRICLVDFSLASIETVANRPLPNDTLEGTIEYISPEQTGRMKRSVDYRSDIYSLGVIAYQLATKHTPFTSDDYLELVFQHLAKDPEPPSRLNANIPASFEKIILKMLEKSPEQRYQSTFATKSDLLRARDLLGTKEPNDLDVGLDDIPEQLFIPDRLLHRDAQLTQTKTSIEKCVQGEFRVLTINGERGTGKTSLLREVPKLLVQHPSIVTTTNCGLGNVDVPLSGLAGILKDLTKQLLSRNDLVSIGDALSLKVGTNAHLLLEIAPDLNRILAKPEDHQGRENPVDAKNRLQNTVQAFLRVLSEVASPLVVCIDNAHWLDTSTQELLNNLAARNELRGILLILSGRFNEDHDVTPGLPTQVTNLKIGNLRKEDLQQILAECLYRSTDEVDELAALLFTKTKGNPQALREFLNELNKSDHLFFDRQHREWTWNLEFAARLPPTDNVGEGLAQNLIDLDEATIQVLKIAACVGNEFELDTIKRVSGMSFSATSACLIRAVAEGFLLYQPDSKQSSYVFAHEKIQQSAYEMLESLERKQIHAQIGKTYLSQLEDDSKLFDVVNQLNNSVQDPGTDSDDPTTLAQLNLDAGKKAKNSGAFQAAFRYLRTAIAVQGKHVWQNYQLSLEIHLEAAEAAYYCGDKRQLDSLVTATLENAACAADKSKAYEIQLRAFIADNDLDVAIDIGHSVLELLGYPLPKNISRRKMAYLSIKNLLSTKLTPQKNLRMEDRDALAAMRVLMILSQAGYHGGRRTTAAYTLKMTEISLAHGLAPESSFAYPLFGALIISFFGSITAGYQFGRAALENLNSQNPELFCRTNTVVYNFIWFWKHHLRDTLAPLKEAELLGFENGDIEFAQIAATTQCVNGFLVGQDLNTLDANFQAKNAKADEFNQTPMLSTGLVYQQCIKNLQTPSAGPWILEGDLYNEVECEPVHRADGDLTSLTNLYVIKSFLAVLFQNDASYEYAIRARRTIDSLVSTPAVPFFTFIESLALLKQAGKVSPIEWLRLKLRIQLNLRRLRKWSQHAPMNFGHLFHLVQAEIHAAENRLDRAIDHYEAAMYKAEDSGYIQLLGMAQELTGRFYEKQGKSSLSIFYLRQARSSYVRWGASAKVFTLDAEYESLTNDPSSTQYPRRQQVSSLKDTTERFDDTYFDLGSVIKASQVLSGEIILETLLEKLMQVALENAGAHSAGLVLTDGDELCVEILSQYNGSRTDHKLKRELVTESNQLPQSVIQYVARTEEDLVLNDAPNDDIFTQDEYIVRVQPKSILCFPILSKSHLTGVLYLENLRSEHAFSPDRIAVLKLLASQSAIAIENAKLYQQLNDSRNKYLALYENAVEGIFEINMQGELISINPAAAQLVGYEGWMEGDKREIDFSRFFVRTEDLLEFSNLLRKDLRVVGFETEVKRLDNSRIWVAISAHAINDDSGTPVRVEGSIIDITEQKLRQEAEQATRLAEAATETKSQFLANMSHEIRTPMNAILGYTKLALETRLDSTQTDYLETIKNSSGHLLRVVNDILDISKIESGKLELQHQPFNLDDVLVDVEQLFTLEAEAKGLRLTMPEKNNGHYIGDPVRLGQVLINLIGNAIKFTNKGSVDVEMDTLSLQNGTQCLNFVISDTGPGIAESQLHRIFEAFTQTPQLSHEGGTGLGLAISKNLVERMDGHIHATSAEGIGSKFYFSVVLEPTIKLQKVPTSTHQKSAPVNNKTLLLVEDNPINLNLAREVLVSAGYEVLTAEDGQAALDVLQEHTVSVVLMDLRMPRMSGNEAIKVIRRSPELQDLNVIALSAGVLQHEIDEALLNGFDHYVTKPVDFDNLLRLLASIGGMTEPPIKVQPPPQETEQDQNILGIDFGLALKNHDYDEDLLRRLTLDFVEIYGDAAQDLRAAIRDGNSEKAERLLHNIAGVAGSFGANSLMANCRSLEQMVAKQSPVESGDVDQFKQEMQTLVSAIGKLHETKAALQG